MRLVSVAIAHALVPAFAIAAAAPADAQVTTVDEGSFTLYRGPARVGREDFSIRLAPGTSGQAPVAQATAAQGTRRINPSINADTSGFPNRYSRELRDSGRVVEAYLGTVVSGRYASRRQHADGESAREFRLPPGTVVADDDVVHHLWAIARRGNGTVPVLVPQRNVVESVRVESTGRAVVVIDLRRFDTTRYLLHGPTGPPREIWVDDAGRIIKAVLPGVGLTAVRD